MFPENTRELAEKKQHFQQRILKHGATLAKPFLKPAH